MTALAIRFEDREAEAELAALRVRDGLLGDELAALTAKIHQHFAFIGLHFDAECKTLAALQAELAELTAPPKPQAAPAAEPPPNERAAKRLFRQSAQRCHPDRTDDELLHGIFLQAKDAYARGDVAALEELRQVLGANAAPRTAVERRFLRLQVERDKLTADVAAKERALAALRMSQEASQVHIWEQRVALIGQEGALAELRQALFAQLQSLRNNIAFHRAMRRQQAAYSRYATQATSTASGGLWNTLFGGGM